MFSQSSQEHCQSRFYKVNFVPNLRDTSGYFPKMQLISSCAVAIQLNEGVESPCLLTY